MRIFSIDGGPELARAISDRLGLEIAPLEVRRFSDGECKIRPLVNVNGEDVYVIATLASEDGLSVHEKLCQALFLIGTLKDAMASAVTLVAPYLCYARKDQRTKLRDPVTIRYLSVMLEAVGLDRVIAMDVHNLAAFESSFRVPTDHLSARDTLARSLAELVGRDPVMLLAPDFGGAKRVYGLRHVFDVLRGSDDSSFGLVVKERSRDELKSGPLLGDARDRTVIIFDDLISSGATVAKAAAKCKELGARQVIVAATHAMLNGDYVANLGSAAIDKVIVTNSVIRAASLPQELLSKFVIVDSSRIFAKAMEAMHSRETLIESTDLT